MLVKLFRLLLINKESQQRFLNNGSIPANAFVPKGFVKGPDNKDFRSTSHVKVETNVKEAKTLWETAKKKQIYKTLLFNHNN